MTDGEYNEQYSGPASATQALTLCNAMKAQGIVREERGVASIENLSPDDVAPMAVFLASDASARVTGHTLMVDDGYLAAVNDASIDAVHLKTTAGSATISPATSRPGRSLAPGGGG